MNELTPTSRTRATPKTLDPTLKKSDLLALTQVAQLVANPNLTQGASPQELREQMESLEAVLGGPSATEQAEQANANQKRRKNPTPPAPAALGAASASKPPAAASAPAATPSEVKLPNGFNTTAAMTKIFFTGINASGRSYLAEKIGAKVIEFNDVLASAWQGPAPSAAEYARLVAWADGIYNDSYPNTLERNSFLRSVHVEGFGIPGYLGRALLSLASQQPADVILLAVTNVSTPEQYKTLKDAGWLHFHVCASQTTMSGRCRVPDPCDGMGTSLNQQAAGRIQKESKGDKLPVVWSDPVVAPPSERFYSAEEFAAHIKSLTNPTGSSTLTIVI